MERFGFPVGNPIVLSRRKTCRPYLLSKQEAPTRQPYWVLIRWKAVLWYSDRAFHSLRACDTVPYCVAPVTRHSKQYLNKKKAAERQRGLSVSILLRMFCLAIS